MDSSYRSYSPKERRRGRTAKALKRIGGTICIVGIGGFALYSFHQNHKDPGSVSTDKTITVATFPKPTPSPVISHPPIDTKTLQDSLQTIVDAHPELLMSVSFADMDTDAKVSINGDQPYTAASTGKMVPATLFLTQVEQGKQSLDKKLGTATAQYQLKQMINQSNNDSWALFNTLLGDDAEQAYAAQIGLTAYKREGNILSANDMALLLTKLYKGTLLNKDNTDLLLSYMLDTNEESLLPKGLPTKAVIYHKYGELEDNVHDGAIVKNADHTYVLTVFSNGKGYYNYDARADVFHDVAAAVEKSWPAATH